MKLRQLVALPAALLFALTSMCSHAQLTRMRPYTGEITRPNPPSEIHIESQLPDGRISSSTDSYKDILAQMRSPNSQERSSAAKRLTGERRDHGYLIRDLTPLLATDDPNVARSVSSVLLMEVVESPYRGPNLATDAETIRQLYWKTEDVYTRANCVGLLAFSLVEFASVEEIFIDAVTNRSTIELQNAAIAIQHFAPPSIGLFKNLTARLKKDEPIVADVVTAMTRIAASVNSGDEGFSADRLMDGSKAVRQLGGFDEQAAFLALVADRIRSNHAGESVAFIANNKDRSFRIHLSLNPEVFETPGLHVNGSELPKFFLTPDRHGLKYLGDRQPLQQGLNILRAAKATTHVWLEDNVVRRFEQPYKRSYAVIAAIDDYENVGRRASVARSQYRSLGRMADKAGVLADTLERTGFPRGNIFLLINEKATSKGIRTLLEEFWSGGRYSDADRVFFYFGGHGNYVERDSGDGVNERTGILITADYDPKRPTTSAILMRDLTGRHFENIVSNHVLMLIDSCSAGLALPKFQGTEQDSSVLTRFRRYVTLTSELKRPARNILVAGTGRQEALWENGGIFTESLIEAMHGRADFNRDRVVEFDELALYVKDSVRAKASSTGVEQEPAAFKASIYGKGSVLMIPE
jgi:hypothetical protein